MGKYDELVERLKYCSDNTRDEYLHELAGRAATAITTLEAEVERLAGAWKLQHKEKMKERAEAKLWFKRAQEWRAELTALEAMCETLAGFAEHDSDCVLGIPKAIRSRSSIQEECTCGLTQALTEWRDQ